MNDASSSDMHSFRSLSDMMIACMDKCIIINQCKGDKKERV